MGLYGKFTNVLNSKQNLILNLNEFNTPLFVNITEPYGWGMYIPLKTSLYTIEKDLCQDIYSKINYEVNDIQMVVDETVICAGIPALRLSAMQKEEGGSNDACNVRTILFSCSLFLYCNILGP